MQMQWVYIEDIGKWVGREVELRGWLYAKSSKGKLHFLQVRDGTGTIQCVVFKGDVSDETFAGADHLFQESSLIVRGTVREDKRSPLGFELGVKEIEPVQIAADYPITPKEHGTAFLMDHRHLWLRSRRQHAILRIRHEIIRACRNYLDDHGFTLLDSPMLTPAACEGTTTLFEIDYFGEPAFLTQSGQLYQEAGAMAFGKVYCFGPCFRAEKSKTRRHLMEFWMLEPEVAWLDLNGDMDLAEDLIVHVVGQVLKNKRPELEFLERDLAALERVQKPLPRITYDEALALLKQDGINLNWGDDFGGDDETVLSKHFDRPVLVHRYPAAMKAFYMKPDPARPEVALCVDMLAPEGYGEIVGGGQREDDPGALEARLAAHNLPREAFTWYLDLRRFGTVPHAGFGLGIERTVAWLCGLTHVRETIPFPRMLGKIWP
jgi:asparaginyl-tRNA synthetase